jgi:hypothetical protein
METVMTTIKNTWDITYLKDIDGKYNAQIFSIGQVYKELKGYTTLNQAIKAASHFINNVGG